MLTASTGGRGTQNAGRGAGGTAGGGCRCGGREGVTNGWVRAQTPLLRGNFWACQCCHKSPSSFSRRAESMNRLSLNGSRGGEDSAAHSLAPGVWVGGDSWAGPRNGASIGQNRAAARRAVGWRPQCSPHANRHVVQVDGGGGSRGGCSAACGRGLWCWRRRSCLCSVRVEQGALGEGDQRRWPRLLMGADGSR